MAKKTLFKFDRRVQEFLNSTMKGLEEGTVELTDEYGDCMREKFQEGSQNGPTIWDNLKKLVDNEGVVDVTDNFDNIKQLYYLEWFSNCLNKKKDNFKEDPNLDAFVTWYLDKGCEIGALLFYYYGDDIWADPEE